MNSLRLKLVKSGSVLGSGAAFFGAAYYGSGAALKTESKAVINANVERCASQLHNRPTEAIRLPKACLPDAKVFNTKHTTATLYEPAKQETVVLTDKTVYELPARQQFIKNNLVSSETVRTWNDSRHRSQLVVAGFAGVLCASVLGIAFTRRPPEDDEEFGGNEDYSLLDDEFDDDEDY